MYKKEPLVSVMMPARNAGDFLLEAIESILNQTYKNLELIIVDDASTDDSYKIAKSFLDSRVRVFRNNKNLGITKSANFAVGKARGEFIARMDADDISYSDRIEKQVEFLLENKDTVAVGGQCDLIDSNCIKIGEKRFPLEFEKIKRMIFQSVPVQQPSLMVAVARLPKEFVWYDETFKTAEELELLFKLFEYGKVRNLKSKVLKYRIHKGNTSLKNPKQTFNLTIKTRIKAIKKYGYKPTFFGVLVTLAEMVVVNILPEKWIYPVYSTLRGMKHMSLDDRIRPNVEVSEA